MRHRSYCFPIITVRMCGGPEIFGKLLGVIPTPAGNLGILGRRSQCDWEHQFKTPIVFIYLLTEK